tara:strand:- start:344 stop:976 length:633 start_codon:yes stop_codon:yes gene_type:complete
MLFKSLMKIDRIIILFSLILMFFIACTSYESIPTADSCIIFEHKKHWYKATKKSYDKWNTPIAFQLAVVNQESSFKQFAKPKRNKIFGLIPINRPTTAFGYAQVTNPTWKWYKEQTGNDNASRANFYDISDFIGWYSQKTYEILNISKNDFYNQYLAYHEGQGGWKKKSYKSKKWLIEVAKKVESNANLYNNQLKECENKLNKKGLFGIF